MYLLQSSIIFAVCMALDAKRLNPVSAGHWAGLPSHAVGPAHNVQGLLAEELMWFLLQALIFFAVMASNIAWDWAPNPYVAALIGVGLAIGATQIVTGIQFLAAVLRRNRRPPAIAVSMSSNIP